MMMNLQSLNSEYCYMLSSCDFASTIGDLTKLNTSKESMPTLDIVKQAVLELIEGRDHKLTASEQDNMKLSLARLLLCLVLRVRIKEEQDLADFLVQFPEMGEEFLLAVVLETGLIKAFVQNLCELDADIGRPILISITSPSISVDALQLYLMAVKASDQLAKLIANKASIPVVVASNAHYYLRHLLQIMKLPENGVNSPEVVSEFISLLDSYIDAYCLTGERRVQLTSLFNVRTDADQIFGDLFLLSHGVYQDPIFHPQLDKNATKLLQIFDELVMDLDMAKVKSDTVDFYQLWLQARRLRQVLRQHENKIVANKVEKFESRLRYRLLKASKFTQDTKIDDCIFLLNKNLHRREITGLLIEMLTEPANSVRIVPFLEKNLILLCDVDFLVKLIHVTRIAKVQSRTKKYKTNLLSDLLKRTFIKSSFRTQNEVLLGAHKDGVENMMFDASIDQEGIQVLNRMTLKEDVIIGGTFSEVAWLVLQKPREILEQMLHLASSNADYCKVVDKLLNVLPNIGLIQIGDEVKMTNLVLCLQNLLQTELNEQQQNNVISLCSALVQAPCLNTRELVLDVIFRSLSVKNVQATNRTPFYFSLAILEHLLNLGLLWRCANIPAVISILYCLCEVVSYTGKEIHCNNHASIKERCKNAIANLSKIWKTEEFDSRVAVWLESKLNALNGLTQFLFLNFEPYPQKRIRASLVRGTVDFIRAQEPTDVHSALLRILSLACLNDELHQYFKDMSGNRKVPYSVLVTGLVERMPNSTLEELTRTCDLLVTWLTKGTVTVRDRRIGVVPFVSKIWLDSVLVLFHPDIVWVDITMKAYAVRNYSQILKKMSAECNEVDDEIRLLRDGIEALSKLEASVGEPLLILILDLIKNLKAKNSNTALLKKMEIFRRTERSDLKRIAANLG